MNRSSGCRTRGARPRAPAIAAILALAASGCSDYLARRDTLTLETGDAVQANIATHVIDPWPAASRRVNRDVDGARLAGAVERYRSPPLNAGAPGGTVPFGASAAPPAPPAGLVR